MPWALRLFSCTSNILIGIIFTLPITTAKCARVVKISRKDAKAQSDKKNPGVFAAWREMIRGQPTFKRLFFQLHTKSVRNAIDESEVGRYGAYIVNGSIIKADGA